jgi:lipopolysaccharide/colanic/teichoic acid biosynthesis glycosyltransferase
LKKTPFSETVLSEEIVIKESNSYYLFFKRTFDLIVSVILVIFLFPFFVLISVIIFLETGNSPIFAQQRGLILEGNEFIIYKFRTLRHSKIAMKESAHIFRKDDLSGLVTFTGFILRRTGLDELPQLMNVLIGEMSLVGPRPLSLEDLHMMKDYDPGLYARRKAISSKPGITGFWQIYGNRQKGLEDLIEADEHYEENKSFFFDLYLITMTIPIMFFTKHSDAIIGKYKEF